MGILGSILGGTLQAVFAAAAQWAATGASWLLGQLGAAMTATTTVDLGSSWFTQHLRAMAAVSAAVIVPMLCCGAIVAIYRQDASMLLRGFLVKLPLALLFTGVAVELVRMGLTVTDDLSAYVLAPAGADTTNLLTNLATTLGSASPFTGVPVFVVFIGAVLLSMASLVLWLELVVRAAAVAAATLFLPLALAGLVWPATAHWCRRLAETIAALVLSKLVIAAVLSLAVGAVSAGITGSSDTSGGFAAVVVGIALLAIATTSPFLLLRLVPAIESGAALHFESTRRNLQHLAMAPVRATNVAMEMASGAGLLAMGSGAAAGGSAGVDAADVGPVTPAGTATNVTRGNNGPSAEDLLGDRALVPASTTSNPASNSAPKDFGDGPADGGDGGDGARR